MRQSGRSSAAENAATNVYSAQGRQTNFGNKFLEGGIPMQRLQSAVHADGDNLSFVPIDGSLQKFQRSLLVSQQAVGDGNFVCGEFALRLQTPFNAGHRAQHTRASGREKSLFRGARNFEP